MPRRRNRAPDLLTRYRFVNTEKAKKSWEEVARSQGWDSSDSVELGPHTAYQYRNDPKHLCFVLSRYKFCSKLLSGKKNVLEIGCGDAFGTPIVAQAVGSLLCLDWDQRLIESNKRRLGFLKNCVFRQQDVISEPVPRAFDAVYSVDVVEHIDPSLEDAFMTNICRALSDDGICVIGTPNVKAEAYASMSSKLGHINLKDAAGLRVLLSRHFRNVFVFSMNDEVVHTGFDGMAHYLFGVGVDPRRGS